MAKSVGEITAYLKLDLSHYAEGVKTALAMGKVLEESLGNIKIKVDSPDVDLSGFNQEIDKLKSSLEDFTPQTGGLKSAADELVDSSDNLKGSFSDLDETTDNLGDTIEDTEAGTESLASGMNAGTASAIAYTAVITALVAAMVNGINQYLEASAVVDRFDYILQKNNATVHESNLLRQQANQLKGYFTEEEILNSQAQFLQMGKSIEQTHRLTEAATNLAAANKLSGQSSMSLMDATEVLGKATTENIGSLRDSIGALSDQEQQVLESLPVHEQFSYLLDIVNDRLGEQREILEETDLGKLKEMGNAWNDVTEGFGEGFVNSLDDINSMMSVTTDESDGLTDSMIGLEVAATGVGYVLGTALVAATGPIAGVFIGIGTAINHVNDLLNDNQEELLVLRQYLESPAPEAFFGTLGGMIADAMSWGLELLGVIEDIRIAGSTIQDDVGALLPEVKAKNATRSQPEKRRGGSRGRITKQEQEILSEIAKIEREINELLKVRVVTVTELNSENKVAVKEIDDKIKDLRDRIAELKSDILNIDVEGTTKKVQDWLSTNPFKIKLDMEAFVKSGDFQKLQEDLAEQRKQEILSSDDFQFAQLSLNTLVQTFRLNFSDAWRKIFGEADSLGEQFLQSFFSRLFDLLLNYALSSALNAIFPGAGIIPQLFGGAGPAAGGLPGTGAPAAGGFDNPQVNPLYNTPAAPILVNVPVQINNSLDMIQTLVKYFPEYLNKEKGSDL